MIWYRLPTSLAVVLSIVALQYLTINPLRLADNVNIAPALRYTGHTAEVSTSYGACLDNGMALGLGCSGSCLVGKWDIIRQASEGGLAKPVT